MTPAGPDRDHEDALHVHFRATGHTYHVHAGTRHQALVDALDKLGTATGPPSDIKKLNTVLTLVKFLGPDIRPASIALLLGLLPPAAVKRNGDFTRGGIAAGVALLRSTNMEKSQMERWLDEEIKRRKLNFTARDAMRWFYECSNVKASVPRGALEMFRAFRPEPSPSLTEAVAKERAAQILDRAVAMKAGPLTRPRRRG